jgi:hypothetical protein
MKNPKIFKMRQLLLFLFFQFVVMITYAQSTINGRVLQNSQAIISYVNIGIKGKNIGTVSNEKGDFSLSIKNENRQDTLVFSCIGFEELSLPIQKIIQENISDFYLKEKVLEINEVVISSQKSKLKVIGTKSTNPLLWGSASSKDGKDIVEMGKIIELNKKTELQKMHIYLKGINTDSAMFRINFYAIKDEMPAERLNKKNILYKKKLSNGWLEIDLTEYNLVFENDFVVSIEFLPQKDSKGYSFWYGGQMGGSTLIRTSSLGTWKKMKGASVSIYLTAKQQLN